MDVAKHVGGQIQNKFGWGVKMTGFDIEVVVNIGKNHATMVDFSSNGDF